MRDPDGAGNMAARGPGPQQAGAPDLRQIEALIDADTIEAAWQIHQTAMAAFGFDRMIYGFTRFQSGAQVTDLADVLILSNHAPDYIDPWLQQGYVHQSPMTRWALGQTGACSWRWIAEQEARGTLSDAERRTVAFNRRMDVTAGYTISFGAIGGRNRGAIGLCARAGMSQDQVDLIWADAGPEILMLNKLLHLRITTLPYTPASRALTHRQREVLEWISEGKTALEIATILGVTPATVEKHLRLARAALGAGTTAQAVLRASMFHQIFQTPR